MKCRERESNSGVFVNDLVFIFHPAHEQNLNRLECDSARRDSEVLGQISVLSLQNDARASVQQKKQFDFLYCVFIKETRHVLH